MSQSQFTGKKQGTSLESLLATIDRETESSLAQDMMLLKEEALRNVRVRNPYVSFFLGRHEMALPIGAIQEIGYLPKVTPLPNLPVWIKGVVQIRGEILSIVDFVALFTLGEDLGKNIKPSYVLFNRQGFKFCLLINRITGVVTFDEHRDALAKALPFEGDGLNKISGFIRGVLSLEDRQVCILDSEKLGKSSLIRKWQS